MVEGLRQRKKRAAMRTIQGTALELFTEQGFDQVTVTQIAQACDFSPSTIYRYFTTKEGLVIYDEFDDELFATVIDHLGHHDSPLTALRLAMLTITEDHFGQHRTQTMAKVRLWKSEPSIKAAVGQRFEEMIELGAKVLAESGNYQLAEAKVVAAAFTHAMLTCISNWFDDGGRKPFAHYAETGLAALARATDTTTPSPHQQ